MHDGAIPARTGGIESQHLTACAGIEEETLLCPRRNKGSLLELCKNICSD